MNLLERYNQRLRSLEDDAITRLHGVMDASFYRLVRRACIHIRPPYRDPGERDLALLQEFQQLVPTFRVGPGAPCHVPDVIGSLLFVADV